MADIVSRFPIEVDLALDVTEGAEASRLRSDPGAYELCFGVVDGEQIMCIALGAATPANGLRSVLESHLPDPSAARLEDDLYVFEAWLLRNGVRVHTASVPFRVKGRLLQVATQATRPTSVDNDKTIESAHNESVFDDLAGYVGEPVYINEEKVARNASFARGFAVIPSVVPRDRALEVARFIEEHVVAQSARYAAKMGGATVGGWYIADCFRVPELAHLFDEVTADPRLRKFLAAQLGDDFYLLERSEMYIGRAVPWHFDAIYSSISMFGAHLGGVVHDAESSWSSLPMRSKTVTVAIYFRDHDKDGKGLTVIPYSHLKSTARARTEELAYAGKLKGEHVSTRAGDAVVFDSLLLHRGIGKADADFSRKPGTEHRITLSLSFGRADAASEAFSRGFGFRGKLYHYNSSICPKRQGDANMQSACIYEAARRDLSNRPMRGVPDGEPFNFRHRQKPHRPQTMTSIVTPFVAES